MNDKNIDEILIMAKQILPAPISDRQIEVLEFMYNDLNMSPELIEYLLQFCTNMGKTVFAYLRAMAINWHDKGFTTVQQVQEFEDRLNGRTAPAIVNPTKFANFNQRTDDLDALVMKRMMERRG